MSKAKVEIHQLPVPANHAPRHEDGGLDEINLAGLDGEPSTLTIHKGLTGGTHGVTGTIVGTSDPQILTNKRHQPRVSFVASGDISPDVSVADIYIRTAQAAAITINNPVGAPVQGEKLIIRLMDNGVARVIAWGPQYRALEYPLPVITVANRLLYMGFIFNATDVRWDMVAINQE